MNQLKLRRPYLKDAIQTEILNDSEINIIFQGVKAVFTFELAETSICLDISGFDCEEIIQGAIEVLFISYPIKEIELINSIGYCRSDLRMLRKDNSIILSREAFSALPGIWTSKERMLATPVNWVKTKEVLHPERENPQANDRLYERFVSAIQKTVSFRVIDPEKDLKIFFEWQHKPRVSFFWEMTLSENELRDYLQRSLADPHSIPTIVELDGRAIGYIEFYWVKEDRLGPIYDSGHFDRGFHFLIGEDDCLGFKNTDAVLKSICHYIFLDEVRTPIISAEPRSDNKAVLKYVETFYSWRIVKEFDFPHKRATLLECRRDLFFQGGHPWS